MTATEVVALLSALPKDQRYRASKVIAQAEKAGWTHIRFFDRLGLTDRDEWDLIGERPGSEGCQPTTEFLFDFILE